MTSANQFPWFDLDIRGVFEPDHLLTPFHPATVNDNLSTSFYSTSNSFACNDNNAFDHLSNDQFFGLQIPPSVSPPVTQPEKFSSKKPGEHRSGPQGQSSQQELSNGNDLARILSRKKAQNRAAQIAFRQKKEKYVKDLEEKVASIEKAQKRIAAENGLLGKRLERLWLENQTLRAGSKVCVSSTPKSHVMSSPKAQNHCGGMSTMHIVGNLNPGQRLITFSDAWDRITSHHLFIEGRLDFTSIIQQLTVPYHAKNHVSYIQEHLIITAINKSATKDTDYLS